MKLTCADEYKNWINLGPINLIWFARIWTITAAQISEGFLIIAGVGGRSLRNIPKKSAACRLD